MSNQYAISDGNRVAALLGHSGVGNDASTIRAVVTSEGALTTTSNDVAPTDTTKNNPSYALSYDASDQLGTVEMTIGTVAYTKTLTWTDGVLTAVGSWEEA